ncbi:hypothetical protein PtA15_7A506 [Puccinia triticina]|uniref:CRA domain-containing protein n=1 Tax=Puccinia triticina TaxID=208348 RepID=A0ABY7CS25_9BASI|nr:uncharacterized protein PtA15_7A506 [Puccinia triticina]WAQ86777.1 hypothetical protein PtA15_7A506 [Puccinia triticina]
MSQRYLTDPSLSSGNHPTHPSSSTSPAMFLNEHGPRRPTDPAEMRQLILDYLCHQCFVDTASAFARESAPSSNRPRPETADGPAHAPSKTPSADKPNQSTLAVKDTVVERTVRFDTDDDGDAEMGDLVDTSSSHGLLHSNLPGVSGSSEEHLANETSSLPRDEMSVNGENSSANRLAGTDRGGYYPDWTAQDVQTTRIRLAIKEHIVGGRIKEAIKLIEAHFPAVLGPPLTPKSCGTSMPGSSSTTAHNPYSSTAPDPSTSSGQTPGTSNGQIPNHVLAQRKARISFANRPLRGAVSSRSGLNSSSMSSSSPNRSQNNSRQGSSKIDLNTTSAPISSSDMILSQSHLSHGSFGSLNPAHVALNLQIQFFVEFVRSISQSQPTNSNGLEHDSENRTRGSSAAPGTENGHANGKMSEHAVRKLGGSSPTSHSGGPSNGMATDLSNSVGALSDDTSTTSSSVSTRTTSLALSLPHCRALHDFVHQLPEPVERAIFAKELENVAGLLAYVDPWDSPVRKYLDQSRRDLLAHRVNAAILVHLGRSPTSILQLVAQQTCFTWSMLTELEEQISCPTPEEKSRTKPIDFFNFQEFVNLNDFGDGRGNSNTTTG